MNTFSFVPCICSFTIHASQHPTSLTLCKICINTRLSADWVWLISWQLSIDVLRWTEPTSEWWWEYDSKSLRVAVTHDSNSFNGHVKSTVMDTGDWLSWMGCWRSLRLSVTGRTLKKNYTITALWRATYHFSPFSPEQIHSRVWFCFHEQWAWLTAGMYVCLWHTLPLCPIA